MEKENVHLTMKFMRSVSPGVPRRCCDTELRGFQLWVGNKSMTYYLRKKFNGTDYTIRLGQWPGMTVEEARAKAIDRLGAISNHGDIKSSPGRARPTLRHALDAYLGRTDLSRGRLLGIRYYTRHFYHLLDKRIDALDGTTLADLHASMGDIKQTADKTIKGIRAIVRWFNGTVIDMPRGFRYYSCPPRMRYISGDEIQRFRSALEEYAGTGELHARYADLFWMLLYTGARPANVVNMRIECISGNVWTIPANEFKTRRETTVFLGRREKELIQKHSGNRTAGYVFLQKRFSGKPLSNIGVHFKRVLKLAGIDDLHIYDLRRTIATWMLSSGAPIEIVSKKLAHSSIRVTETVYAHAIPDAVTDATEKALDAMLGQ